LSALFMNQNEARALTDSDVNATGEALAAKLMKMGVQRAVVTSGSAPLLAIDGGRVSTLPPFVSTKVRDVTGAGDSLAGVTMLRVIQGLDFAQAVRHGIAAASLTVESENVVADFTDEDLERRLAEVPQPAGART